MSFLQDVLSITKSTTCLAAAKKIGVSPTLLRSINKNEYCPSLETADIIKEKTGLNIVFYLNPENRKKFEKKLAELKQSRIEPLQRAIQIAGGRGNLCKITGLSPSVISKPMCGERKLSKHSIRLIANAVGMSVSDFSDINNFQPIQNKKVKTPDYFDDLKKHWLMFLINTGMRKMNLNPYNDPFEVARLLNLCGAPFEAFKKISCAGIAGRKKDTVQDLKEAVFTVQRIIDDIDAGRAYRPNKQLIDIAEIVEMYAVNSVQKEALRLLLTDHYTNYQSTSYLKACIGKLEELIQTTN